MREQSQRKVESEVLELETCDKKGRAILLLNLKLYQELHAALVEQATDLHCFDDRGEVGSPLFTTVQHILNGISWVLVCCSISICCQLVNKVC